MAGLTGGRSVAFEIDPEAWTDIEKGIAYQKGYESDIEVFDPDTGAGGFFCFVGSHRRRIRNG